MEKGCMFGKVSRRYTLIETQIYTDILALLISDCPTVLICGVSAYKICANLRETKKLQEFY